MLYFIDLFKRFKNLKLISKFFISLFILFELAVIILVSIKVDYEVNVPGYLEDASYVVDVDNDNSRGIICTVSVASFRNANMIQYLVAKIDSRLSVSKIEKTSYNNAEYQRYSIYLKKQAINESIIFAYTKAQEKDPNIIISYVYNGVLVALTTQKNDLKQGDIITKIENQDITSLSDFQSKLQIIFEDKKVNDLVSLTFLRYNEDSKSYNELTRDVPIYENENQKLVLGLVCIDDYTLNPSNSIPSFSINYNEKVDASGNSGGAMMALSIYNALLEDDITYNLIVSGTGTINKEGIIGSIGGIEQKTIKTYYGNVDVFLVDDYYKDEDGFSDYDYAIKTCKNLGIDSSFVKPVKTFDDILNILESLGNKDE